MSDLPGELMIAINTAKQVWPHTMDAQEWAHEFLKRFPAASPQHPDEADMIGWFANAIMAGYDTANLRRADHDAKVRQELADADVESMYSEEWEEWVAKVKAYLRGETK